MSQADNARIEALEAQVTELNVRISFLEGKVSALFDRNESKDMMHEMYPATTGPKPGRRSG